MSTYLLHSLNSIDRLIFSKSFSIFQISGDEGFEPPSDCISNHMPIFKTGAFPIRLIPHKMEEGMGLEPAHPVKDYCISNAVPAPYWGQLLLGENGGEARIWTWTWFTPWWISSPLPCLIRRLPLEMVGLPGFEPELPD